MAEAKDPAIKLFGKTIPLPDDVIDEELTSSDNDRKVSPVDEDLSCDIAPQERDFSDKDDQDGTSSHIEESGVPPQSPDKSSCKDPSLRTTDDPKALLEPSKSEEEKAETGVSQEKTLKKPDKILPCPRCNSMDTKFCYYNNYNVNQPRHFCRNCQRYWTAGGSMRNVPVGAGRRKNKSSVSHYRQITVPETLHITRPDVPNGTHPGLQSDGTVPTFGSDPPLCESMASILNLAKKKMMNCPAPNGSRTPQELNGSCLEATTKSSPKDIAAQNCLPYPTQIPCYPDAPWPYPWTSAQWTPPVAAPSFCSNGLALAYYPAPAYWGIPWVAQPFPAAQSGSSSGPNSATLGKHTRDGKILTPTSSVEKESENDSGERSLWVPKTLRIDDPEEAAKSSIWTTLGIRHNEKPKSIGRGSGLFKAFQSKSDERTPSLETSNVLEANPAALSRSQIFQENSER